MGAAIDQIISQIRKEMDGNGHCFTTISYENFRTQYIEAIGDSTKRICSSVRVEIEQALSDVGLCAFPPVNEIKRNGQYYRFFKSNSILWDLFKSLRDPDETTDKRLANYINKIRQEPIDIEGETVILVNITESVHR